MPRKNATAEVETPVSAKECSHTHESCSGGCSGLRIWAAVFVVVLAQVVSTAYFSDLSVRKNIESIKTFEYEKTGGKENFELLGKAQRLQLKGQIEQIKAFVSESEKEGGSTDSGSAAPSASKTMTQDEVAALQKDSYFEGDAKARILAIEYTDPECPFCIRQAKDGVLTKLLEKHAGKVKVSHKPFRAVPHEGAEPKALAMLCVGKIAGADAYNSYYNAIMDRSTQEKVMPVDNLLSLAKELKIDEKKFSACYDAKETMSAYDAYTSEGRKYGVSGTPGTLIVDTETGKYELIAGAYPFENFDKAVSNLLK